MEGNSWNGWNGVAGGISCKWRLKMPVNTSEVMSSFAENWKIISTAVAKSYWSIYSPLLSQKDTQFTSFRSPDSSKPALTT